MYSLATQLGTAELLISNLPKDARFGLLVDAKIEMAGGARPRRPIEQMADLMKSADQVKAIAPVVFPLLAESLSERILNGTLSAEIIVSDDVLNLLLKEHAEQVSASLESGRCLLLEADEELSFGLALIDDETMCLGIYDELMRLLGTVTNDSDVAVEWALNCFNMYRAGTEEVFLRGSSFSTGERTTV